MDFQRLENESEEAYIFRICQMKEEIGTWQQVADILNDALGVNHTESKYRREFKKHEAEYIVNISELNETEIQRRAIEREKIKFRDERRAWNKQNYIDSRVEEKLDLLEEQLLSIGRIQFENHEKLEIDSDNDMLILLSDFHIGASYNSFIGEYNTEIAKERLGKLLRETIEIQKRHNSQKCYITLLGDMINGSIHKNIQITNSENVVEQIKIATELVSAFAYELSKHFETIFISSVCGNHSRIDKKEDALHSERLDDLIIWATELCLNGVDNIHILKRNIDTGIVDLNIRNKTYIGIHGDYDSFNKTGVSNLSMMLGFIPYAILFGHLHTCAVDESHGVKMIRGGCLGGSGDDYTLEKRLVSKPSQMVCICNKDGVYCYYPIELN